MRIVPVNMVWRDVEIADDDGVSTKCKAMVPLARFHNVCARQYADGEEYPLVPLEPRSRKSHNHYFAAIHEAFQNLPENIAARWPSEEHLRKWALCEVGICDETTFRFDKPEDAILLARQYRRNARDDYVHITVSKSTSTVILRWAKSQSVAAMGKEAFQESKKAVLELLEHLTDVPKGALMNEAMRNA